MEARAISVKVLASRTSMNGEMFGSEEMTDDKITPVRGRVENITSLMFAGKISESEVLTVIFLQGSRRGDKHRF